MLMESPDTERWLLNKVWNSLQMGWKKLIPNLPPNSFAAFDGASNHSITEDKVPT